MFDLFVLGDWLEFTVRWLHVITAIAWIGSSFYFIALDLGLRREGPLPEGVAGEEWQVHGGGFYHINKYMVAPANLPEHLVWFKWEAYWTWISGFALLVLVYYFGADLFLIDPHVMDLATWQAIGISVVSLVAGWVLYSSLCNSKLGDNPPVMMGVLFPHHRGIQLFLRAGVFRPRGAPASGRVHGHHHGRQRRHGDHPQSEDRRRRHEGGARAGRQIWQDRQAALDAQQLSHPAGPVPDAVDPLSAGLCKRLQLDHRGLVFLVGVFVRHFFNTMHATKEKLIWPWFAAAATMLVIAVLSMAPMWNGHDPWEDETSMSPRQEQFAAAPGFEDVSAIVLGRCSMCHAQEPTWFDTYWAPKGVRLETPWQIAQHAHTSPCRPATPTPCRRRTFPASPRKSARKLSPGIAPGGPASAPMSFPAVEPARHHPPSAHLRARSYQHQTFRQPHAHR
jgi:heme exporter protein D